MPASSNHERRKLRRITEEIAELGRYVGDLLLPVTCAGCGNYGKKLCTPCWQQWQTGARRAEHLAPALERGVQLPVWTAALYEGSVRKSLVELKERGRVDVAELVLGAAMRVAERAGPPLCAGLSQLTGARQIWIVPIPTRKPLWLTQREVNLPAFFAAHLARYLRRYGVLAEVSEILCQRLFTRDQVGLKRAQRLKNRRETMRLRSSSIELSGCPVLVVDDILTTGSTLREAVRELEHAGAAVVAGAVIAATPRRNLPRREFPA